jgi:hypothetical protein
MARALQQPLRTAQGSMQPPQVVKCGQLVLVQDIVRIFVPIRLRVGGVRMRWSEFVFDVLDCGFDVLDDLIHDLRDARRLRKGLAVIRSFVTWV